MRLNRCRHSVLLVFAVSLLAAFLAPQADAAGLVVSTLPQATQGGDLITGPDGAIWLNGRYGEEHEGGVGSFIGRLGVHGNVEQFPLPDGRQAGAPVAGPEGDVWFPEGHSEEDDKGYGVARVTTSGQLQEYTLSSDGGYVEAMAASGNDLWVGATLANKHGEEERSVVERVATSPDVSVAQQFTLRPPCSSSAIAARAGAVWFAEICEPRRPAHRTRSAKIVRIGPTGELARYRLPSLAFVESLAIGPDGSVWFGSFGANGRRIEFGLITPSGQLTRYRVPDGDPATMAIGPEGRLWFRSSFGGNVYSGLNSIGPKGHVGKPICAGPKCQLEVDGLTTGPDGNLWFSATEAHAPYGGGGGGALIEANQRANEPGVIGRLMPPQRSSIP